MPQFWQCTKTETWKFCDLFFFLIKISLEKVSWFNQILFRNAQRKKIAKTRLWLWVHISWTLTVKGSKLCVILRIDLNNFGILNSFHSEMFKVRKSSENDFNWKVNISRSTRVKASKFYVIRRLDLNSSFPKFGILTSFHSEILKVRKSTPNDFNSNVNISGSTAVKASNFRVILRLDFNNSLQKLDILTSFYSKILKVRKSTKNEFKWSFNISRST